MRATIRTYDVWGNEEEGFEVNDVYTYGTYDFTGNINNDDDILDFLNSEFFSKAQSFDTIEFGIDDIEYITVDEKGTGMPILEICFDGTK